MRLEIAERAEQDIEEIGDHIALDSPLAAEGVVAKIEAKFAAIAQQPLLYAEQSDIAPGFRRALVYPYSIWFRIKDVDTVRIERVVHGARDLQPLFESEG
ncbi:MAG: type II toxin-antitoxin system RelE/ParE family toxin [Phycisphaerales bacterium]|nr:type II toxin-antitoxin system RelE/ParE family toxin [Hyphomonadaceae bacterium]